MSQTETYRSIGDLPPIPDDGYIGLHDVARLSGGGDPGALENACIRLSLPLETNGPGWGRMRTRDLSALLGAVQARTVARMHRPEMTRHTKLGSVLGVAPGEVFRLAQLRGVTVDPTQPVPEVSRSGAILLRQILDVERGLPVEAGDWIKGEAILPRLRAVMRTHLTGGPDDPDPGFAGQADPDAELVTRCRWLDIRHRKERTGRWSYGRVEVVGFDLYRLTGIQPSAGDVSPYLEMMLHAYRTVVPGDPSTD